MPVCRATSLFVSFVLTALVCACGPRADNTAPAPYDAGARPGIVAIRNGVPTELYEVGAVQEGGDLVFRVGYTLNATDADANMRAVEVQVDWTACNGQAKQWRTTEDIPSEFWGNREAQITGITTGDPVRVLGNCAEGDEFLVSARVIDARGNYSNRVEVLLNIQVTQG